MNATELFVLSGKSAGIYFCEVCRVVARTKEEAERCCKPKRCADCGNEVERSVTICDSCWNIRLAKQEQAKFDKAQKVPLADYSGPVLIPGTDDFYQSVTDMLDYLTAEELPDYVWACTARPVCVLNYGDIIESATQDAYEDFDPDCLHGRKELEAAIEAFNAANTANTANEMWEPDYSKVVICKQP